jgi:DNA polymerase-3 subunit gamma/tau
MAYQALARKWRPRKFSEIVGQDHVVRALLHAIGHDRLHHAYLFTGTRGVGKTTIARILAKAMNCESPEGPEPCGICTSCRELDEGRFVDLVEVDAASRTKVEDTRDLLDNVLYAPTQGRYKVYLIDEVHMLSAHSFNALLKTLEEPPPHVKFLLATTDPQKIPVTVLSRCLQFNLKRLTPEQIRLQMESILGQESVAFEANAIRSLSRAADGSLRDGLSLLDQAIAHGGGALTEITVTAMLGTVAREPVLDILEALVAGDAGLLLGRIQELDQHAPNYGDVLQEMLVILHHAGIAQWAPEIAQRDEDGEAILGLASKAKAEDLQLYYQIALLGQKDLPLAPDPLMGFEMLMLRMLAFRPKGTVEHASAAKPARHVEPQAVRVETVARPPAPRKVEPPVHVAVTPPPVVSTERPAKQPELGGVPGVVPMKDGAVDWPALIDCLGLAAMARELAKNSTLLELSHEVCRIGLDARLDQMKSPRAVASLEKSLQLHLARPVVLRVETTQGEAETPARQQQKIESHRRESAEAAVERDPVIRELMEHMDARVVPGSIQTKDN